MKLDESNPIDEQITNEDNSVTNKDGDNMLEQEEGANVQDKPDDVRVPTVTPGSTDADDSSEDIVEQDNNVTEVDPSNKNKGPAGENL